MSKLASLFSAVTFAVLLIAVTAVALARGGGGGGGGGHGGGGGGHMGGMSGGGGVGRGAGISPGIRGYTGGGYRGPSAGYYGGYRGFGPGYRGYGWGYPNYGYGWGYPYYGYGLGLGLGLGYGLGMGYGYGGYGYGGYGNGGYGYGYPTYSNVTYNNVNTVPATGVAATSAATQAGAPTPPTEEALAAAREFMERGDAAFKAGKYADAVYAWRHAIVDAPQNPILVLQLAQALFATGKYEESAGAVQAAMRQLPKEQWGIVVSNYKQMYANTQDYTKQLRALEKAVKSKPKDPASRFLLGYHYGYLGFLKQSVEQLDQVIEIEPRDEMAKKLRDEMSQRTVNLDTPPPAPAPISEISWTKSQ